MNKGSLSSGLNIKKVETRRERLKNRAMAHAKDIRVINKQKEVNEKANLEKEPDLSSLLQTSKHKPRSRPQKRNNSKEKTTIRERTSTRRASSTTQSRRTPTTSENKIGKRSLSRSRLNTTSSTQNRPSTTSVGSRTSRIPRRPVSRQPSRNNQESNQVKRNVSRPGTTPGGSRQSTRTLRKPINQQESKPSRNTSRPGTTPVGSRSQVKTRRRMIPTSSTLKKDSTDTKSTSRPKVKQAWNTPQKENVPTSSTKTPKKTRKKVQQAWGTPQKENVPKSSTTKKPTLSNRSPLKRRSNESIREPNQFKNLSKVEQEELLQKYIEEQRLKQPGKELTSHLIATRHIEKSTPNDQLIQELMKLKKLHLDREQLTELANLECYSNVTHMYLQYNRLVELSDQFEFLPELQFLVLSHNKLEKLHTSLGSCQHLQFIDLSHNALSEEVILDALDYLPKSLQYLNISGNPGDSQAVRKAFKEDFPTLKFLGESVTKMNPQPKGNTSSLVLNESSEKSSKKNKAEMAENLTFVEIKQQQAKYENFHHLAEARKKLESTFSKAVGVSRFADAIEDKKKASQERLRQQREQFNKKLQEMKDELLNQ